MAVFGPWVKCKVFLHTKRLSIGMNVDKEGNLLDILRRWVTF